MPSSFSEKKIYKSTWQLFNDHYFSTFLCETSLHVLKTGAEGKAVEQRVIVIRICVTLVKAV